MRLSLLAPGGKALYFPLPGASLGRWPHSCNICLYTSTAERSRKQRSTLNARGALVFVGLGPYWCQKVSTKDLVIECIERF